MKDKNTLPTIQIGDLIQVTKHTFDAGYFQRDTGRKVTGSEAILSRQAGLYRVLRVFRRTGNVFAIYTGFTERGSDPQVIEPKHIISKVEERRAA